jgi:hypothetical protein
VNSVSGFALDFGYGFALDFCSYASCKLTAALCCTESATYYCCMVYTLLFIFVQFALYQQKKLPLSFYPFGNPWLSLQPQSICISALFVNVHKLSFQTQVAFNSCH